MHRQDDSRHPGWLQSRWDRQKRDTATRIEVAVTALQKDHVEVTYANICKRVGLLYGLSISPNTIKRNELAYQLYLANRRSPKRRQLREPLLIELINSTSDLEKRSLRSKTSRLRRESKDSLIARLISLKRTVTKQKTTVSIFGQTSKEFESLLDTGSVYRQPVSRDAEKRPALCLAETEDHRQGPVIEQYQNERQVEYVTYQLWIDSAEEPLRSASILARNSGITRVEMLNLEKDCLIIRKDDPDEDGNWGDLIIKRGLKRRARKRVLKINKESKSVLENLISQSKCRHVFSQPRHPDQKLQPWILESEIGRLREKLARDKIKLDPDAGLHTLRHTFLTEAGEHTDAFTLQYIAGHDTIKTTMRYVHPRAESVSRAFGRINQKKKSAESA